VELVDGMRGRVTPADLERAAQALRDHADTDCARGDHVIPPLALLRPGTYACSHCHAPVCVPYPQIENTGERGGSV
jgi:hypothetical protein